MSRFRLLAVASLVAVGLSAPAVVLFGGDTAQSEFSASHPLGQNRIETARLDIEIGRTLQGAEAKNMAPGDRRLLEVELRNVGTLPLVFNMRVQPDGSSLSRALTRDQWIGSCETDEPVASAATDLVASGIPIEAGGSIIACFAAVLPLGASNDLQNSAAGYNVVIDAEHDLEQR